MSQIDWPKWWGWELELSGHLLRRMADRKFSETDLRAMLADASSYSRDIEPDRWIISTKWDNDDWEIVVEPDPSIQRLVIITGYMVQ
ncbi:MAG: DUF4258 domain-containing protein [Planctomycetota bacterium]|jgi:hypothetical protein